MPRKGCTTELHTSPLLVCRLPSCVPRGLSVSALGTCLATSPLCAQIPSDQIRNDTGNLLSCLCDGVCTAHLEGQHPLNSPTLQGKLLPHGPAESKSPEGFVFAIVLANTAGSNYFGGAGW